MGVGTTILSFIIGMLGLFIMILVHELGHLAAAKFLKVKVDTFSIGYGKKLWGFSRGGTTYQIAVFPFGGFTKFHGEHVFAKALEQHLDAMPDDPDLFYNQPAWKRVLISFAGPFANVLFAVVFFTIVFLIGFNEYSYGNRIILQSDLEKISSASAAVATYPADAAGLRTGDRIIGINGKTITRFTDIQTALIDVYQRPIPITVMRADGSIRELSVTPVLNSRTGGGKIGVSSDADAVIASLDSAAAQMNHWLAPGDRIVEAGGTPVLKLSDLVIAFRGKPVSLPMTVRRGGDIIQGTYYPDYSNNRYPLGIAFAPETLRTPPYTPGEAILKGFDSIGITVYSIALFFIRLPSIDVSKNVSGPIRTTYLIGQSAVEGFGISAGEGIIQFIRILCFLSVVLAVMNLLPLGIMDGGFIVLYLVEMIRRKPYRPRFLYRFQIAGFVVLLIVGILVMTNDILQF